MNTVLFILLIMFAHTLMLSIENLARSTIERAKEAMDGPEYDETIFDQASLEVYQVLLKHFDGFLAELERNAAIPVPEAIIVHEEQP